MNKLKFSLISLLFVSNLGFAQCFDDFPNIRREHVDPYGFLSWSPLSLKTFLEGWLRQESFVEIAINGPFPDTFWVRGHCLAQVAALEGTDQAWLVGSEFGETLSDFMEASHDPA